MSFGVKKGRKTNSQFAPREIGTVSATEFGTFAVNTAKGHYVGSFTSRNQAEFAAGHAFDVRAPGSCHKAN
jgi:hypothetical protein